MTTCARPGCGRVVHSRATGLCGPHFRHHAAGAYDRVPFPAAALDAYRAAGYTDRAVAAAAGIHADSIARSYPGGTVTRHVRDALVTVDLDKAPTQPGWRATRRIRALAALGISYEAMAAETGISAKYIGKIAGGQVLWVMADNFARVQALWAAHQGDTAERHVDARIARRGWAVPFEWEDIDGPDDLHADAMVSAATVRAALKRAAARWGRDRVLELTGLDTPRYYHLRTATTVRESTRARVIGAITREDWRIRARRKHAERTAEKEAAA